MKNITILISQILPIDMEKQLAALGAATFRLPPSPNLSSELRFHPDILTAQIAGKWYFEKGYTPPSCITNYVNLDVKLNDKYPNDCLFNLFEYKGKLYHRSQGIAQLYNGEDIAIKQGYVKCSTIVLGNDNFITSDEWIAKILTADGYNVLRVSNQGIALNGFSCGFIGGCCINFGKIAAFTGSLSRHPSIKPFCQSNGIEVIELSNAALYDYGGAAVVL